MRQSRLALHALALIGLLAGSCPLRAETGPAAASPLSVSIDDFSYVDTSGEVIDQTAAHQRRLDALMRRLRADVAAEPRYRLVSATDEARIKVIGGVQKTSTLVQWAKVAVIDAGATRVLYERLYTFRGDNDEAWDHAAMFVSLHMDSAPNALARGASVYSLSDIASDAEDLAFYENFRRHLRSHLPAAFEKRSACSPRRRDSWSTAPYHRSGNTARIRRTGWFPALPRRCPAQRVRQVHRRQSRSRAPNSACPPATRVCRLGFLPISPSNQTPAP